MMMKRADGVWLFGTYVWSDDESEAVRLDVGKTNVLDAGYEIPRATDCTRCHQGREDSVLGFEAILLAAPNASGLTWDTLRSRGLLSSIGNDNASLPASALSIPGTSGERNALGYLRTRTAACRATTQAQCAAAGFAGMNLRLDLPGRGGTHRRSRRTRRRSGAVCWRWRSCGRTTIDKRLSSGFTQPPSGLVKTTAASNRSPRRRAPSIGEPTSAARSMEATPTKCLTCSHTWSTSLGWRRSLPGSRA